MKTTVRSKVAGRQKSKKPKKVAKSYSAASIAERYLELRRLRQHISEAESRLYAQ